MEKLRKALENFIEAGLIIVLIFATLVFGGVHPTTCAVVQFIVLLLLLCWAIWAVTTDRLQKISFRGVPLHLSFLVLFFVGVCLLQLAFSPVARYTALSIGGNSSGIGIVVLPVTVAPYRTAHELLKVLTYVSVFILSMTVMTRKRRINRIIQLLVFFGGGVSFFGIFQYFARPNMIYWFWEPQQGSSVFGPFPNGNHFASYAGMLVPFTFATALYYGFRERKRRTRRLTVLERAALLVFGSPRRALLFLCALLMICAPFLSRSASGIIGLLCSVLVFVLLLLLDPDRRRYAYWFMPIFAFDIVFALALAIIASRGSAWSLRHCLTVWAGCVKVWLHFPLFGSGLGSFAVVFRLFKDAKLGDTVWNFAMNEPLQLLAETGIAGIALVVCFLISWVRWCTDIRARTRSRWTRWILLAGMSSCAGAIAHSLLDFNFHTPANALLFSVLMGLTCAAAAVGPPVVPPGARLFRIKIRR